MDGREPLDVTLHADLTFRAAHIAALFQMEGLPSSLTTFVLPSLSSLPTLVVALPLLLLVEVAPRPPQKVETPSIQLHQASNPRDHRFNELNQLSTNVKDWINTGA